MAASMGRRTQVEAIDALTAEIRLSNVLAVLAMGPSALEHDDGKRAVTPLAIERVAKRNALRAEARVAFGMEEVDRG